MDLAARGLSITQHLEGRSDHDDRLPRDVYDHDAYLGHWLSVLKSDKRVISQAAARAQRAADYLHGLQLSEAVGTSSIAA